MAVRMRDVAERAGVSVRTVSNVVNDFPHVHPETRRRVQEALTDLGYEMNAAARSLRSGRTGMVALAVPQLDIPYFGELAEEVVTAAEQVGLTVVVELTGARRDRELRVLDGGRRHLVDGVLFSPLGLGDEDVAAARGGFPLVLLGEQGLTVEGVDHVGIDDATAAREVVEHLLAQGAQRLAVVGTHPREQHGTAHRRLVGARQALEAAGRRLAPELAAEVGPYDRRHGAEAMAALLAAPGGPPDAVFAFNDSMALGALRTLQHRGLAVPGEVLLAGFDDAADASFSTPTLTTVSQGRRAIARRAVELLVARIGGSAGPPQRVVLPHRLAVRESTSRRAAVLRPGASDAPPPS